MKDFQMIMKGHNVPIGPVQDQAHIQTIAINSINYNAPDFVMDCCDCSACSKHMGLKLCKMARCYSRCENSENPHCKACQNLI